MSSPIHVALLEKAVAQSGLSVAQFAKQVVIREPSTVGRWLDRSSPIPGVVCDWLDDQAERLAPVEKSRRK